MRTKSLSLMKLILISIWRVVH